MSSKSTKRNRPTDSPQTGNGPQEITLELIYKKLESMEENRIAPIEKKLEEVASNQTDLAKRISFLEEENISLHRHVDFLEQESTRYKVRIIDPALSTVEFNPWKARVLGMIKTTAKVEEVSVRHVALFSSPKGATAILTLASSQQVTAICSQAKDIYQNFKLRVARELTQSQRIEMQKCIDEAKLGKSNPKISVNLAIPVVYVDDVRIWPPNQRRRPGITYANVVSSKPADIYRSVDPVKAVITSPTQPLVTDSAPPMDGSKFIGFAFHWNGQDDIQSFADDLIADAKVLFLINQEKDNVMYAAVALSSGKQRGSSSNFLKILAERRMVNIAIIIFRKYGGTHLHNRRYEIYNEIAKRLLDKLDADGHESRDE